MASNCERGFSLAKLIMTIQRMSLHDRTFEHLTMLKVGHLIYHVTQYRIRCDIALSHDAKNA